MAGVAIVGMACRYPDADSPDELWRNVLAQRRAFRRLPPERLRLEDYASPDPGAPDRTYATEAAVLEGWEFDRSRFRIAGSTFRVTDLTHWLALEVAADAFEDAGYPNGDGIDRVMTGVLVGNTLTGEFSRARAMRLRWPYVRRTVGAALAREGRGAGEVAGFLSELEQAYKAPFEPVDGDTLAGGLSNTIAGRICNTFDLKGGGYTVDGACAASLLAVTNACTALVCRDVDLVLAGGVDLSLDPFELVGFAKAGALARDEMRVFDARADGFWPGEGCGFVLLQRLEDALACGARIHAVVRGWGVSSDGRGGMTRPEVEGQLYALQRAYDRAGCGIDTVPFFEGHGTGTAIGDRTELAALAFARRKAGANRRAAVGSIKANIGHTKAAAGVAGVLKATLALREQVIPPTTGCEEPHEELEKASLRALREPEPWPASAPVRAGVSAMGFGGINAHVVLDGPPAAVRRRSLSKRERRLSASAQDAELFVFAGQDAVELDAQLRRVAALGLDLSRSELTDLAATLYQRLDLKAPARAALVAATPKELVRRLERVRGHLHKGRYLDADRGEAVSINALPPSISFLFPGQASPTYLHGGALARRFEFVRLLYQRASLSGDDPKDTAVAQPAIVVASLAGLAVLRRLGIKGSVAVGHSLGELTALHWAGAIGEQDVVEFAAARGRAMADLAGDRGAMAGVAAGPERVQRLLQREDVRVAGLNGPRQTVVSGPTAAVGRVVRRAEAEGLAASILPVSHAFHSPLVAPAAERIASHLETIELLSPALAIISTVTGRALEPNDDLRELLVRQITTAVHFGPALEEASARSDVLVEVGPGRVLTGLARTAVAKPVLSLDAGGPSLRGLLSAVGALYAMGTPVLLEALFRGRFVRPLRLDRKGRFLASPCESAPVDTANSAPGTVESPPGERSQEANSTANVVQGDPLGVVRRFIARRFELPDSVVQPESTLLGDLHLNSIQVAEVAAAAARALGVAPPVAPAEFAGSTVGELASVLAGRGPSAENVDVEPSGVGLWVRPFAIELVETAPPDSSDRVECNWHTVVPDDYPLATAVPTVFSGGGSQLGVVLCLPPAPSERHLGALLAAAKAVPEIGASRFALVQHGGGATSFAKTLHLELPHVATCIVDAPATPEALALARLEAETTRGFREVVYDSDTRREPILRVLKPELGTLPIGPEDVLLVTGGGKGIGAECALGLAQTSGARVALMGRSLPEQDEALAENLRRFEAAGTDHLYAVADVTDPSTVGAAVTRIESTLGPITAFLHAAGVNVPTRLLDLDEERIRATLAPKVNGLRTVLGALDESRLRVAVGFGSIIGRLGLPGEAHYALANEWLGRELQRLGRRRPGCRCLSLEWSVWAGAGMGERLHVLETLKRAGVTPIPIEDGVRLLEELLRSPQLSGPVVVAGRFGRPSTAAPDHRKLPLFRFLDRVRVHVPQVELVVDVDLSPESDPYLADHRLGQTLLLPAVIALEAAAQVATSLTDVPVVRELHSVRFERPITVPADDKRTIRVAALRRDDNRVEVVIRSDETDFQADHMSVVCALGERSPHPPPSPFLEEGAVLLDSADVLYDTILFQRGRFRRLRSYVGLDTRSCVAEVEASAEVRWFGEYSPQMLALGDPGARDAFVHAVQACIPQDRLLPVAVERIELLCAPTGILQVAAIERLSSNDTHVYDLEIVDEARRVCERWHGLTLKSVGPNPVPAAWPPALLAPYFERRLVELLPHGRISVSIVDKGGRRMRSDSALARAAGADSPVLRRPDGRPEAGGEAAGVSATHVNGTTLALAGPRPVGCDAESVAARGEKLWNDLLGADGLALAQLLSAESSEEVDTSATRVWVALECLRKAGRLAAPLTSGRRADDGWTLLHAGDVEIATFVGSLDTPDRPVAFGFLAGEALQ